MRLSTTRFLLPLGLALALPAHAAEQAGVSAAVRGEVALSRLQVAVGRQVVSGEPILLQDAIKSGQRSGMQILLLDETIFTIGPESELVIDEFVYDPKTSAGKLSAEITKGVFRFVSGKIAHEKPDDMKLKLPSGTLGVRGTMVAGSANEIEKSARLVLLGEGPENDTGAPAGAFEACNVGKCVQVNRPGFGTSIDGPDSPPATPFRFSREELDALTRSVSDPEGWVETASADGDGTPPVASGPAGEGGAEAGDPRSATEVSGISSGGASESSDQTRVRLRTLDGVAQASTDVAQFSEQTVSVGGRVVAVPDDCSDVSSCFPGVTAPFPVDPTTGEPIPIDPGSFTTFDQFSTLAASGLQVAVYQQPGLGLIDINGQPDGSYDFFLEVFLGAQRADLVFGNINSTSLGLSGASIAETTDYSSYPSGYDVPMIFPATGTVVGSPNGPCAVVCQVDGVAGLTNGPAGEIAATATQAVAIVAPDTGTGFVAESVSAQPFLQIPRQ